MVELHLNRERDVLWHSERLLRQLAGGKGEAAAHGSSPNSSTASSPRGSHRGTDCSGSDGACWFRNPSPVVTLEITLGCHRVLQDVTWVLLSAMKNGRSGAAEWCNPQRNGGAPLPPSLSWVQHRADARRRFLLPFNNAASLQRQLRSSPSLFPWLQPHPRLLPLPEEQCHRAALLRPECCFPCRAGAHGGSPSTLQKQAV